MTTDDISAQLAVFAQTFNRSLEKYLTPANDVPASLVEAVHYSVLAPGKRLRPFLVNACCVLVGGRPDDAEVPSVAIECMHAFSLIHDDLPAMDDDALRRGRPTSHVRFGEALAILAGDALALLPFELITMHVPDSDAAAAMVKILARASGWSGMIGGQVADIEGESAPPELGRVEYIHARKTGCLLESACRLGATAGRATGEEQNALAQYGQMLGRAFQIADDLLDVTATAEAMGKRTGKDAAAAKQTYPACVGIDRSRQAAREAVDEAVGALGGFGPAADPLRALAVFASDRNY